MKNLKKIKHILISGKPYEIIWTNDADILQGYIGKTTTIEQKIWLATGKPKEVTQENFWHEIIHVLDEDGQLKLGEEGVVRLSAMLTNVFLSNFKLIPKPETLKEK